jgi:uncharacterized protein with HEPN domain
MPRSAQLYLGDLLEMCRRIRDYTAGLDAASFAADGRTVDAVLRNLEIAGEAVKNLPPEVLAMAPEVPWQKVVRLRDLLAHAYHRIETAVIWRIVQDDVPVLEAVARR